jgi:hypothetical protein
MPLPFVRHGSAFILLAGSVYSQAVTSLPPASASTSLPAACPVDYFQCPESLGFGCCLIGYVCETADGTPACLLTQAGSTLSSPASSSSVAECAGRRGYFSCARAHRGACPCYPHETYPGQGFPSWRLATPNLPSAQVAAQTATTAARQHACPAAQPSA